LPWPTEPVVGFVSGQPSASWYPFMVSGKVGHRSSLSNIPSLSLSPCPVTGFVSGQPSESRYPLRVSGLFGHLSAISGIPSLSVSVVLVGGVSGQPS